MAELVLAVKPRVALSSFLEQCAVLGADVEMIRRVAVTTIKYLHGTALARQRLRLNQDLERRWYASLRTGSPDWSVYDSDYYLAELWACWIVYSRSYLRSMWNPRSLPPKGVIADLGAVANVVDLGCGIGYTTAALVEMFPGAVVTGTNLDGTRQAEFARRLGRRFGFSLASDIHAIARPVDVVFASEYFEHIPAPIAHLHEIVETLRPSAMLVANAFGTQAIGHFEQYEVDGVLQTGKATSAEFNRQMRRLGFVKMKTTLWNNRPVYWKRDA